MPRQRFGFCPSGAYSRRVASKPSVYVVAESPTVSLQLHGLGVVEVSATPGVTRLADGDAKRPLTVNTRAFANVVLARAVEAAVRPATVAELPERDRRSLALTVVRLLGQDRTWKALYGTHLTFDERFFAVLHWYREARHERALVRIGELRRARHEQALSRRTDETEPRSAAPPWLRSVLGLEPSGLTSMARLVPPNPFETSWLTRGAAGLHSGAPTTSKFAELAESLLLQPTAALRRSASLVSTIEVPSQTWVPGSSQAGGLANVVSSALSVVKTVAAEFLSGLVALIKAPRMETLSRVVQPANVEALLGAGRSIAIGAFERVRTSWEHVAREWAEVADLFECLDREGLAFLFEELPMSTAWRFAGLTPAQAEEVFLLAFGDVVAEGHYVRAMQQAVMDAPLLRADQRGHLCHALGHAAAGEWLHAGPPLMVGLEGALRDAANGLQLLPVANRGKFIGAEGFIKRMNIDSAYTTFVVRRVFSTSGNALRHGVRTDSRRQVLLGTVAIAGWLDHFMNVGAMAALVEELDSHLDDALAVVAGARVLAPGAHQLTLPAPARA